MAKKAKPAKSKKPVAKKGSTKASAKRATGTLVSAELPVWYDPLSPMGSAVRQVAGLSSKFNWVGIYLLKGKALHLGPYIGAKTDHTRIPVGKGVCGTAVKEDRDQNVPDVRAIQNYLSCSLETRSELVVLIRDRAGKVRGQIDIDSHTVAAFGPQEETAVREIARELGERWPD